MSASYSPMKSQAQNMGGGDFRYDNSELYSHGTGLFEDAIEGNKTTHMCLYGYVMPFVGCGLIYLCGAGTQGGVFGHGRGHAA